ncbi:hypothetical protein CMK17_21665 [Candidatus Poribacteria bacterium]|nr:hypothetical protein [Candidatus Poribacteria bacterium]
MLLQSLVEGLEFPATGLPGGPDSLGGLGDLAPDGLPLFRGQFANGLLNGLDCRAFPGLPIDDGGRLGGGSGWGGLIVLPLAFAQQESDPVATEEDGEKGQDNVQVVFEGWLHCAGSGG